MISLNKIHKKDLPVIPMSVIILTRGLPFLGGNYDSPDCGRREMARGNGCAIAGNGRLIVAILFCARRKRGRESYGMTGAKDKRNPSQSNQSAEKLLSLMEAMSTLEEPIRLQDLASRLEMNASTVLRFLAPLQRRGYVAQIAESGRYYLTFKLCGLAHNVSSRLNIRNIAIPFMRSLVQIFKESANLSIESDMSVMYIEVVSGPSKTLMTLQRIGHIAPMHCTGVGKLFLLEYSRQKIDQLIAVKGLERFTNNTITEKSELFRLLEEIRRLGYAFDNEECEEGARCIAAPLRDFSGRIVAGISVSGPATRMTDAHIHTHLPFLLEIAEQISFCLGWKANHAEAAGSR
jgi:DNA-binding IclR family transcriptional regulator